MAFSDAYRLQERRHRLIGQHLRGNFSLQLASCFCRIHTCCVLVHIGMYVHGTRALFRSSEATIVASAAIEQLSALRGSRILKNVLMTAVRAAANTHVSILDSVLLFIGDTSSPTHALATCAVMPGTSITSHGGNDKAWVWAALDFADETQKMETLAIRLGTVESAPPTGFVSWLCLHALAATLPAGAHQVVRACSDRCTSLTLMRAPMHPRHCPHATCCEALLHMSLVDPSKSLGFQDCLFGMRANKSHTGTPKCAAQLQSFAARASRHLWPASVWVV